MLYQSSKRHVFLKIVMESPCCILEMIKGQSFRLQTRKKRLAYSFKGKTLIKKREVLELEIERKKSVADLRGAPGTRSPGGPNSFIFMQFSAK